MNKALHGREQTLTKIRIF